MTLTGFLTYTLALGIAAAIPGPGVIALVARALGSGFRSTLPMLFGLALGDVVYLSAAVLGLAYIASSFGTVFMVIKYAGVAYLLWMAVSFWRQGVTAEKVAAQTAGDAFSSFFAGFMVTLGNPKVIVFYLALLPTFLDLSTVTPVDFAVLIVLTFAILVAVLIPYIGLAGRARHMLQSPRALKVMNRIAASFLAGAAAAIAVRAN
ncbi:MAG: lysine transporter LysE [Ahrensia sp.]|nr:lysine transporter LysE [Ahrensia sp.]|tara:strand:- start:415 stop:1032 length:618 start_codon:yes stop_codon:yes gene_type:complete